MQPSNAIIKDEQGNLYSAVSLIRGDVTPIQPQQIKTNMQPANALIQDFDGTIYSLVELLSNMGVGAGEGGSVDLRNYYTKAQVDSLLATRDAEIAELKSALEEIANVIGGAPDLTQINVKLDDTLKELK